jgi:tetratricopeptide (TPR) repeat protein
LGILGFLLLFSLEYIAGTAFAQLPAPNRAAVELKCKIVDSLGEQARTPWIIELRNAAGAPLRRALKMAGDTISFKNLLPGIYRIYLSGRGGRRSSQSVDLTPAPDQSSAQFAKDLKTPKSSPPGSTQHAVNVRSLAIPKAALGEMKRAEKDQLSGNDPAMVRHLEQAIAIYPEYADAYNNLGAHYHRKGEYARSILFFTKVTELSPDFYVGWMNLGGSYLAAGRFREAAEANKKALSLGPDDPIANFQLGLSCYYLHENAEARKSFRRVLELDPALPNAPHLFLAHLAAAEKSYAEASEYLRQYLELHPYAPNAGDARQMMAALAEGLPNPEEPIRK